MLAKTHHVNILTSFRSPAKLTPVVAHRFRPPSHAISIPTSSSHVSSPSAIDVLDESVAAFWDYQFLFVSQRSEAAKPITLPVVDGAIPHDFPSGTYYLVGPGLFADDHGSTVHPLDGHGYLRAFTFDELSREVKFMARYVKTHAQVEEHDPVTDTWRFTHRGPFSVLKGGRKVGNTKVMKNVANTSVLRWGGRVLCLWEGGEPYEIESGTLDTVGRLDVIDGCDSLPESGKNSCDIWDVAAGLLKPLLYGTYIYELSSIMD
jgi:9-cis-beta-carotene 9',10'-cleaving dioxygenase